MNKKEILAVVYKMLEQYLELENFIDDTELLLVEFNFNRGFCQWIHNRAFPSDDYKTILDELAKDKVEGIYPTDRFHYWYETFENKQIFEITITPRIAHLERTVARLKKEIINDTQAII